MGIPRNFNHFLIKHELTIETTNFLSLFQFVAACVRFKHHFRETRLSSLWKIIHQIREELLNMLQTPIHS